MENIPYIDERREAVSRARALKTQESRGAGDMGVATDRGKTVRDTQADVRAALVSAIARTITDRELTQVQAAEICRTDQPTLSKVLRGRTESVSLDKLVRWLLALGRPVELRIGRYSLNNSATLTVEEDGRHPVG